MRLLFLGVAVLGLVASESGVRAMPFDFTYTGSLVTFMVPTTDTYQILAFGAQGGNRDIGTGVGVGGRGAEIGGNFTLTAGEILQIAVGVAGGDDGGGGGGGGSFVVGPNNTPLVIAGGGGGGGANISGGVPGQGGLTGPDGGGPVQDGVPSGGTDGNGGAGSTALAGGGGGGGFFSGGGASITGAPGGAGFPDLTGGGNGGFGGGGASGPGAGGGGGYSGGGGGFRSAAGDGPGGGAGSFDAGTDQILIGDFQTGDGEVVITELAPEPEPEPTSIALLGAGLVGLAVARRRRGSRLER